jgi:hypothetical protein
VVIGNPPYKEKAKGQGGWIENGSANEKTGAQLAAWMPPADWGVGVHAKHLRNLYVYFWRWATWKVFDHDPAHSTGIVCFITVAGFLNGPGFQRMRDYLRRTCDDIWVIDCSPEGHQPEVNTRIFQGVQQPVCIVLASRSTKNDAIIPARVMFHALPEGVREAKFRALGALSLTAPAWTECPANWRAPFLPVSQGAWVTYPKLEDLFVYNGSGTMPGRTWIIAPDTQSLQERWQNLINAPPDRMDTLFHPHMAAGRLGDRHSKRILHDGLPGYESPMWSVADESGFCIPPVRYGYRSFDRQWIIPDNRLINRPNPELWTIRSDRQVYLTALSRTCPWAGPALAFTGLVPDLDHYNGRGGRVFPLWRDSEGTISNLRPQLLGYLSGRYRDAVSAEDLMAYIAATAAHPAFTKRFQDDLSTPGLRIPLTADATTFRKSVEVGRMVIWLHTFGERMVDPSSGRPAQPPRLPADRAPRVPTAGEIPQDPSLMPDTINYDAGKKRLLIGTGYVEPVDLGVWNYEVSGKHALSQWFSYRKANRERPLIGDHRPPSPLCGIQPNYWLAEYTTELINVLNVLAMLVDLEPVQAELLDTICTGLAISTEELNAAGVFAISATSKRISGPQGPDLFGNLH